eukprot:31265-Pelagococcus_subviridis.AAC.28
MPRVLPGRPSSVGENPNDSPGARGRVRRRRSASVGRGFARRGDTHQLLAHPRLAHRAQLRLVENLQPPANGAREAAFDDRQNDSSASRRKI